MGATSWRFKSSYPHHNKNGTQQGAIFVLVWMSRRKPCGAQSLQNLQALYRRRESRRFCLQNGRRCRQGGFQTCLLSKQRGASPQQIRAPFGCVFCRADTDRIAGARRSAFASFFKRFTVSKRRASHVFFKNAGKIVGVIKSD